MVIREGSVTDLSVKMKNKLKLKGRKYDGKSRVSNDLYRKNWDEIFKKRVMEGEDPFMKEQEELKESYEQSKLNKKEREELLKDIEDRNGF